MRIAKFFNRAGTCVKAKFGDLKPIHQEGRKGMKLLVTLPMVCKFMASKGFYRPNDPRLKA